MHINIRYRKDRKISQAIRDRVHGKLGHHIGKYLEDDHPVHIVLASEKDGEHAEMSFHFKGHDIIAKVCEKTLYEAIDRSVENAGRQMDKILEKVKHHKGQESLKTVAVEVVDENVGETK